MGKTRAKQFSLLKTSPTNCQLGDRAMCVQLHGDASFAGQGVIMEGLGLSTFFRFFIHNASNAESIRRIGNLPHFTSGGSVHIVVEYVLSSFSLFHG